MRQVLRRDSLCVGVRTCPDSTLTCSDCGGERVPDDPGFPAPCGCGATEYSRNRCEECRLTKLDYACESAAGALVQRVMDLHFALSQHFTIGLHEVTAEEFEVLKVIEMERAEHQRDIDTTRA